MKLTKSILLLLTAFSFPIFGQNIIQRASLNEDGTITVDKVQDKIYEKVAFRNTYDQLPGFPIIKKAHPMFKNIRNVSLADINEDGRDEIVVCLNETLFAFSGDGEEIWSYQLKGTANFPPAIDDINQDGHLEIAVQTYGVPSVGNAYLLDRFGNIMDGWPLNFGNHYMLNGVTFADLNGDGNKEIILNERVSGTSGKVHAVDINGQSFNSNWPVEIPGTPAFTASVGDLDNNGIMDLVTSTTTAIYAFDANGNVLNGFPFSEEGTKISYQSPLLRDLDEDGMLEIIGARHKADVSIGTFPSIYVINHDGSYYGNWPYFDNLGTYATPSIVDLDQDGDEEFFFGRPYNSEIEQNSILLGFNENGDFLEGFPKTGLSGSEGVIAIADIDEDEIMEIITSSNIIIDGKGSIRIYELENPDETGIELISTEGYTYANGGYLGDINGDGMLDLTALSYQIKFDNTSPDSAFINVFDLKVPYRPELILFNGYKGSNDHSGVKPNPTSSTEELNIQTFEVFPNPTIDYISIPENLINSNFKMELFSIDGKKLSFNQKEYQKINLSKYQAGIYWLKLSDESQIYISKIVKI